MTNRVKKIEEKIKNFNTDLILKDKKSNENSRI